MRTQAHSHHAHPTSTPSNSPPYLRGEPHTTTHHVERIHVSVRIMHAHPLTYLQPTCTFSCCKLDLVEVVMGVIKELACCRKIVRLHHKTLGVMEHEEPKRHGMASWGSMLK